MLNAMAMFTDGMVMEAAGRMSGAVLFIVETQDLLMINGVIGTGGIGNIVNFTGEFTVGLTLRIIIIVHCRTADGDYLYV